MIRNDRSIRLSILLMLAWALMATSVYAEDWPQWLGPNQSSIWESEGIIDAIPESGLKSVWRTEVGWGYSGPAVVGDRLFLTDFVPRDGAVDNNPGKRVKIDGTERVLCFSVADGTLVWKHEYDAPYEISYPKGPRATPTVSGEYVYTLGAEGHLFCLRVADGSVVWSKQLEKDYNIESPIWGFSAAPLVHDELLYCMVGGSGQAVVALNRNTGEEEWKSLDAKDAGYAMPTVIEAGGVEQLIVWPLDRIVSLNPVSGEMYWSIPLKPDYGMSIIVPRKEGHLLFASGIGNIGAAIQLGEDSPTAEIAWTGTVKTGVYCANSTPILVDGVIYGCDCRSGGLIAADLKTGDRFWESFAPTTGNRRAGHGTAFLVRHADRCFLFSESGDLILAKLTREGYTELGRSHLLEPTNEAFGRPVVWTHPAFAHKSVFARNDKELVRVSLAK